MPAGSSGEVTRRAVLRRLAPGRHHSVAMPRLQRKSFATPDQVRNFASGRIEIVRLDEIAVGRFVLQPGWHWAKDVGPIAGTRSCDLRHLGYTISGSIEGRIDDGTVTVTGRGQACA